MKDKQSILFVDDDREFGRVMKKVFERCGFDVTIALDGQYALDILSKDVFALIISDLKMPHIDGKEFMQEMRRKKISAPVIFLTGYGEIESYMDLMNMGAFDYLNKPVDVPEILRVAEKALGVSEASKVSTP